MIIVRFATCAHYGHRLRIPVEEHGLVMAPPRTGNTGLLAKLILHYPGPVVSTTTKADVFELTSGIRAGLRPVRILNPQSIGGVPSTFRWNPIEGCTDEAVAIRWADGFANAVSINGVGDGSFWSSKASSYLPGLFHAPALAGGDMRLIVRWALGNAEDAEEILLDAGARQWATDLGERHAIYFEHDGPCKDSSKAPPVPGKMARRDHDGRNAEGRRLRHRVSGPTKAAVQDALKELRKEIDGGIRRTAPANCTVRRCCEDWLADGLPGRDPKTIANNKYVLEPVLAVIGLIRLRDLDVTDVDRALAAVAAMRSSSTVAMAHLALTRAITRAQDKNLMLRNVSALTGTPPGQRGRPM